MAAVLCNNVANLYRFYAPLGRRYLLLPRSYFTHYCMVNHRAHFAGRNERNTQLVRTISLPNASTMRRNVFQSILVKNAHRTTKDYQSNTAIKARHVRLIDQDGKNLGIVTLREALEKGKKENCMVVEVGRTSSETVCKLISRQQLYEKMREEKKKHVKTSKVKEIKVTGKISEHDLEIKLKKIVEFLQHRDSVKVFVAHRRLQNTSVDDKKALIEKIAGQISDVGSLQGEAKVVGNGLRAIFVPLPRN